MISGDFVRNRKNPFFFYRVWSLVFDNLPEEFCVDEMDGDIAMNQTFHFRMWFSFTPLRPALL